MKANSYKNLIEQTFNFPQEGFQVQDNELYFNDIPLMDIIKQYGTPLKISYLPKISSQIQKAKKLFNVAMAKADYKGKYYYCYCTKSSHFSFVLDEVLKNEVHLETSSAFDIHIIKEQYKKKLVNKDTYIICNGYKKLPYRQNIMELANDNFNIVPVLDHKDEFEHYKKYFKG
ncbi:MAG: arginine decarboxylase, partial [Bacteroidota bacterium]